MIFFKIQLKIKQLNTFFLSRVNVNVAILVGRREYVVNKATTDKPNIRIRGSIIKNILKNVK